MSNVDEITLLVNKISDSEDLIERAEAFYAEHSHEWSDGVAAYFEIFLERKRDQVHYEKHLLERMGWRVALEQDPDAPNI